MRKILFSLLAVLLLVGVANATEIQSSVQPKDYPTVWTETVYNGSGSEIVSGYIVQWDFDTADSVIDYYDDMCPYVKLCDAVDDIWQAGVVVYGKSIPNGANGQIIVKGPAYVISSAAMSVNTLGSSDASGKLGAHGATTDECSLGRIIKANTAIAAGPDNGSGWDLIYVDVNCSD